MEQWAWQELEAQVEEHGSGAVQFYLTNTADTPDEYLELLVTEIKFENEEIRVELE